MTQQTAVELLLERYGEEMTLNGINVRAMIQPLRRTSGAAGNLADEFYDSVHYRYTGPAGQKLRVGDTLKTARRDYSVLRADSFLLNGEEVYNWAILKVLAADAVTEVSLALQGVKIASAQSCAASALQQSEPVTGWGESLPAAVASGAVRYELALENVIPVPGADLYAAADFTVTVVRPAKKTVYSGCRWKTLADSGDVGDRTVHRMELYAARQEEQGSSGT